ncbi:MAG: Uncharacterised protein [Cyanobium sp. ARS6]|nr:MAG: Uncharacterised protein [Cyanobium sp. ARS6]
MTLHQSIKAEHESIIGTEPGGTSRLMVDHRLQQRLGSQDGEHLQLVSPQTPVSVIRDEQCTINPHQTSRHHWHKLKKPLEVGETAQSETDRNQQLLIGTLFLGKTVKQLTQRRCRGQ